MKNIKAFAALTGVLMLIVACNPFDRSSRSFVNLSLPGNGQSVAIRSDNMSIDIKYSGDILFNKEETAIEKISPGGYLDYRMNNKRLLAEAGANGDVVYNFYNDEDYQNENGTGKQFLVEAIAQMISQGMFIKGRMERLYQEGGVSLLLTEARKIKTDNIKIKYIEYILQSDSISQEEMRKTLNIIATTMGSDNDKKEILGKVPLDYLQDAVTATAFFTAVESINSDNDKATALRKLLKQPLPESAFKSLLSSAKTINSDNDKANLLKDVIHNDFFAGSGYNSLLGVINSIGADNDKANILKILIDKTIYPGEQFNSLLAVVNGIHADNDKAGVLKQLAGKDIGTVEGWISLINQTTSISSDNDKAGVLLEVSKKMPRDENTIAAYMKASRTISADNDYQRAVKPVK